MTTENDTTQTTRPFIIAIEGIDKSGKHTLAKGLVSYFEQNNYTAEHSEFHRYDTPTGEMISRYLKKQIELSAEASEMVMAADKLNQLDYIENCKADVLIFDRYLLSQYAYAKAKKDTGLSSVEPYLLTQVLDPMPIADVTICLLLDPATSMARKGKHGDNDRYESDLALLTAVNDAIESTPLKLYTDLKMTIKLDDEATPEAILTVVKNYFEDILDHQKEEIT